MNVDFRHFSFAMQLLWACKEGNLEDVQAVVNNTPQDQRAALLRAEAYRLCRGLASNSSVSLLFIRLLETSHPSPECLQLQSTGLHAAAYRGHTAVISYLCDVGAEVDMRDVVRRVGKVCTRPLTQGLV
jgi:ankyrin repeat protein